MELATRIIEINGSHYVRIPANMALYFKIHGKTDAKIEDIASDTARITFLS